MNSDEMGHDCGGWAMLLGVAAGIAAASVAIGLYVRARRSDRGIVSVDQIIEGVQEKMRAVQEMIDSQRSALEGV